MALKDLQKHVEKGGKKVKELADKARKAAIGVAVTASTVVPSLAAEKTGNNNDNTPLTQTEQTVENSHSSQSGATLSWEEAVNISSAQSNDNNTESADSSPDQQNEAEDNNVIDLYGTPIIQEQQKDGVVTAVNGAAIFPYELDGKEIAKEWKEEQKDLFANAEPDKVDTVSLAQMADGVGAYYSMTDKNITTRNIDMSNIDMKMLSELYVKQKPELSKEAAIQEFQSAMGQMSSLNDPQSLAARSLRAHEEQHRTNDKLGIYAPGLSPEQYGILNQYDECAANVAELNCILSDYKKALAAGQSKEEALKIFDKGLDQKFDFYKDSLAAGLDPDSKEGKQLMVQGTIKMWQENYQSHYADQTGGTGAEAVDRSDAATTILGNEQELQKRIDKIFDNIGENDYCKQNGIKSPGNLSKHLPDKQMELEPDVKQYIADAVEGHIGFDAESREQIDQSIAGNTDKKQIKNLLKILTGRKSPEEVAAKKPKPGKEQTKTVSYEQLAQMQQENTY